MPHKVFRQSDPREYRTAAAEYRIGGRVAKFALLPPP